MYADLSVLIGAFQLICIKFLQLTTYINFFIFYDEML